MCFVEVDIDVIIKEKCKDPEFKRGFEKVEERYEKKRILVRKDIEQLIE